MTERKRLTVILATRYEIARATVRIATRALTDISAPLASGEYQEAALRLERAERNTEAARKALLPKEQGVTLRCNWPGCNASLTTGLINIKANRTWAASVAGGGWIRGMRKRSTGSPKTGTGQSANGRWDICPEHAPLERAEQEARDADAVIRRAARAAIRALPIEQRIEARKARAKARRQAKCDATKAAT